MYEPVKSGLYTPVSLDTLRRIAEVTKNPKLVVAYLALARHADGRSIAGYPPHTLTGAGANKVKKVTAVAERTASLLVNSLVNHGFISRAPEDARKLKSKLTYQLHPEGNLVDIPHALIDGLDIGGRYIEGISRIWSMASTPEKILPALMLLLELYAANDMESWGGVSPKYIYRQWVTDAAVPADGGTFRWIARAEKESAYWVLIGNALAYMGLKYTDGKKKEQDNLLSETFWAAWRLIRKAGFIYETVYVVDGDTPVVPIRVNDFHSDADRGNAETQDPSFLKINEGLGFYTPAQNEMEDPEGVWFYWYEDPTPSGLSLKGIYRPRFRAANPATSRGITRDREEARALLGRVDAALVA